MNTLLITDNYFFPVLKETFNRDEYYYTIGNIHKNPCLVLMVSKFDNKWLLCVEDLNYEPTCALDKELDRGFGTIEMVHGALKAAKHHRKSKSISVL